MHGPHFLKKYLHCRGAGVGAELLILLLNTGVASSRISLIIWSHFGAAFFPSWTCFFLFEAAIFFRGVSFPTEIFKAKLLAEWNNVAIHAVFCNVVKSVNSVNFKNFTNIQSVNSANFKNFTNIFNEKYLAYKFL